MTRLLIIPAAGTGSRLGAALPKVLVPVAGRPMLDHLLARYAGVVNHFVLVVAPHAEAAVAAQIKDRTESIELVTQPSPTGMLDAIMAAYDAAWRRQPDRIWITWCDQVAIHERTVANVIQGETAPAEPALILPTCESRDPYIHLERDADGHILRVLHRREGDAMPPVGESDMGLFSLSRGAFLRDLKVYAEAPLAGGTTGERNFLPFLAWLGATSRVVTFPCWHPMEAVGINTPDDLRRVEAYLQELVAGDDAS